MSEQNRLVEWTASPGARAPLSSAEAFLERGISEPDRGANDLRRALASLREETGAAGVALVEVVDGGPEGWRIVYEGRRGRRSRRWLRDAFADLGALGEAAALSLDARHLSGVPCSPGATPLLPRPQGKDIPRGFLALWTWEPDGGDLPGLRGRMEGFGRSLALLLEVEQKERLCMGGRGISGKEELARALRDGDEGAVPALLTLARTTGGADLAYWGSVHDGIVDVEWHLGARDRGFGFELPLGRGVGGRAFAGEKILEVPDYLNCQYRYPGVSDVTDSEDVRSTLAVPIRGEDPKTGAVLYAVRRELSPFSPAERLLLGRLARSIEPLPGVRPARRHFFPAAEDPVGAAKAELRRMLLDPPEVQEVETWLEKLARGPAMLVDNARRPYVPAKADRLEGLLGSHREPTVVPLEHPRVPGGRGHLYLWPSVELPPTGWPDLLDDAATICALVLDRAEQAYDRLNHARSRWLRDVSEGRIGPSARREGNRLGLPVDRGVVWAIAWRPKGAEGADGAEEMRRRMLAEDVALDRLGSPLISDDGGVGVLLLKEETHERPTAVRDDLLAFFGPEPLWLVHGVAYDSLDALRDALARTVAAVERARDEDSCRHVQEVWGQGLDGLLENPKVFRELDEFARGTLEPLLDHDSKNGSQLTRTFCLALVEGQEATARRLFIHTNTVRYRVKRAAQVLGANLDVPKERVALSLAALVLLRRDDTPP